jgi:type IV pilus assembly protein PilW
LRIMPMGSPPVPYLVALHNFGDPDDAVEEGQFAPVVQNATNFQVAYMMNRPLPTSGIPPSDTAGNGDWILGNDESDPLPNTASTAPNYDNDYEHTTRFNTHPANIRAIRVTLSASGDQNPAASVRSSWYLPENSPDVDAGTDRFHSTIGTAVSAPNMGSRTFFVPFPSADCDGQADCNRWGG